MSWLSPKVVIAAAIVGLIVGVFFYGRKTMNDEWQTRTLQKSVEALRGRRDTNDAVKNLSDADLCRALGGMPDDNGKCL